MFHQVLQKRIIGDLCYVVVPLWVDVCEDRGCTQEGRGDGSKTCKANSANRRRNAEESTDYCEGDVTDRGKNYDRRFKSLCKHG